MVVVPLDRFSAVTRSWFDGAFSEPTPAQAQAWAAISSGQDALVVAPTGSGKTLAAFLWSLDQIAQAPLPEAKRRCRVLYVSPLKALAVDVERNLRAPLTGMRHAAVRLGLPEPSITIGVRSGDTPAAERRALVRTPPDILITTPESLFLLLTSQSREALRGIQTVIVDEVHAVVATKRGAHLALSLERLDALLDRPAQRIGLSATVRPLDEVARFLGGARDVTVVAPPSAKQIEVRVEVPVEDMTALDESPAAGPNPDDAAAPVRKASIWPWLEEHVVDLIREHRSTLVFANSRRLAERLCARLNEIASGLEAPPDNVPAQLMGGSGMSGGAGHEIARAHHGSVSREQRSQIEEALKAGRLPAVVATSSLELGIDMGAVDLVVQVEAPPSVASGLQRVGRAGHQVGAISRGVVLPKYRGDLVQAAVVAERMVAGAIEQMRYPRNPLDVLAQQLVALCAMDTWQVDALLALVRRAAPFATLPVSAYEATLDMLAGRYPSDDFAELRPRLVWDRVTGTVSGRPGAQRLAVTSGGTIPDRGLFGVFLVGEKASRVGELDEEMVYESRVGDVFALGASSWRIEEITHDRVLVSPAPGQAGRLPFWHGDAPGRPVELGKAIGAFLRELGRLPPAEATARAVAAGLDDRAARNLVDYVDEQRQATGVVPDDRTLLVERFRDELGDWRIAVHSPFGAPVNAPWALALVARLREQHGVDVQALHSDDGIVLRLPEMETPPTAAAVLFEPDEVEPLVQGEVGTSALFASRFRECAARALLLPRRHPGRRSPLWQQRQRSAQLLSVAAQFGSFPVILETMRECLQDVFDVPGLVGLMREIADRQVRLVEVETPAPSPFARSLLFGYVAAYLYEGDAPLAERRAQALALDTTLLAELLGQAELRELLDADVVAEVEREIALLTPERRARDEEGAADLLRRLGDLSTAELLARGATPAWLAKLEEARRAIRLRIAGEERWAAAEDAGRYLDALGVPLPVGVPEAFLEPVADPLADLVSRYARTHGPFTPAQVAHRFGVGTAVVQAALDRLSARGRVVSGEFRPAGTGLEWCDAEVLRMLRRRSLARLRQQVEPVLPETLGRFLPRWQGVGSSSGRGVDALFRAVEQLAGAAIPASALESLVLPARVAGYQAGLLDELTAAGDLVWAGTGALPGQDGWITLSPTESAALLLPTPDPNAVATPLHEQIMAAFADASALFFRTLTERLDAAVDDAAVASAMWDLVWGGYLTNDTLTPLRARLAASGRASGVAHRARRPPPRARPGRYGILGRPTGTTRSAPPTVAGRWSALPSRDADGTRRAHAAAEVLLDRHGVVTRGAVMAERLSGGFAAVYPVLKAAEESGRARRGYFVAGLGAAQFALPGAVDRMRATDIAAPAAPEPSWITPPAGAPAGRAPGPHDRAVLLAATDPANPYGAALPWPDRGPESGGHKPGRKAGALVVLVDGHLVLYVERGGRTLLTFAEEAERLGPAVDALALAVREGHLGKITVEKADGAHLLAREEQGSPLSEALRDAGFRATPRGLRLRA
ncbi:MAG TPA: ATP-dependent helicase [Mycobacteriales bacterium]|nr:ATP-dependent helicase [Mycobacteriales bacterium]